MIEFERDIAESTLRILQKKTWNNFNINDLLKKKNTRKLKIKSKNDLLKFINRFVDWHLINNTKDIEQSSTKDMLFEVLMARFDILQLYRAAFINIYNGFKKSPYQLINLLPSFLESMITTAELAHFDVNGLKGNFRLKGLIVVYFITFIHWKNDSSPSLEKTMTQLDKNLDQAENFGKILS
tara:strand:+ start:3484 stop:4029 length:546 start_codon:yes stop_codon:yes gene_type:complete